MFYAAEPLVRSTIRFRFLARLVLVGGKVSTH